MIGMQREGTIYLVWLNRNQPNPVYSAGFADYGSSQGAMKMRTLVGWEALVKFLIQEVKLRPAILASISNGLHDEGNASVFNVVLTDEQLAELGLK
jgi:hypothetical protein